MAVAFEHNATDPYRRRNSRISRNSRFSNRVGRHGYRAVGRAGR